MVPKDIQKYVRSWAETSTEEECSYSSDEHAFVVIDRHILRARRLCKKYKIPYYVDEDEED